MWKFIGCCAGHYVWIALYHGPTMESLILAVFLGTLMFTVITRDTYGGA